MTRPRLEPPLPTVSSLPPLKRSIDAEYGNSVALPGGEIAQLHRQIKPDRTRSAIWPVFGIGRPLPLPRDKLTFYRTGIGIIACHWSLSWEIAGTLWPGTPASQYFAARWH
jgi:hypothetical protein